jgi:hypothetical protein
MKARELKPGDLFKVNPPDPESPVRVCLTNDEQSGLRFGWPGSKVWIIGGLPQHTGYWCYMGEEVEVELVST